MRKAATAPKGTAGLRQAHEGAAVGFRDGAPDHQGGRQEAREPIKERTLLKLNDARERPYRPPPHALKDIKSVRHRRPRRRRLSRSNEDCTGRAVNVVRIRNCSAPRAKSTTVAMSWIADALPPRAFRSAPPLSGGGSSARRHDWLLGSAKADGTRSQLQIPEVAHQKVEGKVACRGGVKE